MKNRNPVITIKYSIDGIQMRDVIDFLRIIIHSLEIMLYWFIRNGGNRTEILLHDIYENQNHLWRPAQREKADKRWAHRFDFAIPFHR